MSQGEIPDIKQELLIHIRNADIISTSDRGVTTSTDTGTFSADSSHTLATNPTLVKNVRSVVVATVTLSFGTDYTVNYNTGVISFTSPQTGAYTIQYDQGSNDRIFPDFPQPYLKRGQFPRIAVDVLGGPSTPAGTGSTTADYNNYTVSIVSYDSDQENVETMIAAIRRTIKDNKKDFYNFRYITPTTLSPILPVPFGENKIMSRTQDCLIQNQFES